MDDVGGDGGGEGGGGNGCGFGTEDGAEFFDGAEDALLGGVFGDAKGCADVAHRSVFEEAQGDGLAIGFAEGGEGVIEMGLDLRPERVGLRCE